MFLSRCGLLVFLFILSLMACLPTLSEIPRVISGQMPFCQLISNLISSVTHILAPTSPVPHNNNTSMLAQAVTWVTNNIQTYPVWTFSSALVILTETFLEFFCYLWNESNVVWKGMCACIWRYIVCNSVPDYSDTHFWRVKSHINKTSFCHIMHAHFYQRDMNWLCFFSLIWVYYIWWWQNTYWNTYSETPI
jgi:hypothetical protein